MLHFYTAVWPIRPVLEYACPVWHSSIIKKQFNRIESVQNEFCFNNNLLSLHELRRELSKRFFLLVVFYRRRVVCTICFLV